MTPAPDPAYKRCPKCGQRNRFAAKNCTQCGTPFMLVKADGVLRKRCASCGHYIRAGAKVCTNCGTAFLTLAAGKLRAPKWCPQCGEARKPTAKVCTNCGHKFRNPAAAEPPLVQSDVLATPVSGSAVARPAKAWPRPAFDTSGEPAPFLSDDELKRLRDAQQRKRSRLQAALDFVRAIIQGKP